jgi:serine/threonine protein kinase/Tol biopolymer transport system component
LLVAPGTRLGVYDITAQIGEGGMGQVYRATDTKLKRQVAIKILPPSLAADADRLARFQREAEMLASLNHPHIAAIYGLEESAAATALVMELIEGDDLSQRIARGAIPLDEALPIAKQIADALEAAHEQGIIHRDLKPANIKVRDDGTVKVLDFGLAKALDPAGGAGRAGEAGRVGLSMSPTITSPAQMTGSGVILGTAAYMAPEQARGKPVDKRADIWAFGCVLFEMLAGRRAFPADDITDAIVGIVSKEPDWSALPDTVPAVVLTYLKRCLQKDVRQRVRDIGDVRLALEGAFEPAVVSAVDARESRAPQRTWLSWSLAAAAVVVIVALTVPALRHLRETSAPGLPETRADIVTPETDEPTSFALSPDGRQIVFVASVNGVSRLWLRPLSGTQAQPLAGTDGARAPFWSPDGRAIAFFASATLKRLDLGSDTPRVLAPVIIGQGGTWNTDGVILFAPSLLTPVMRVSASGGPAQPVTILASGETGHLAPTFLPDGRRFLYLVFGLADTSGIYLGAIDNPRAPTRLTAADSRAAYLAADAPDGGWLLWSRGGALLAQRLDIDRAMLTGTPLTLGDRINTVSTASSGLIAYRAMAAPRRQLTWVDRDGVARGTVGEIENAGLGPSPRVSPDGRRIAVTRLMQGNDDVWILEGGRSSRLTFDPASDASGVWSPDGSRMAFYSTRTGVFGTFQKLTSGVGAEEQLIQSNELAIATSWSPDGRFLLYFQRNLESLTDLWVWPVTKTAAEEANSRTPAPFVKTPASDVFGMFSPDGRWVAYQSNQSGRNEIYVRPFAWPLSATASTGTQWQVSTDGGIRPTWSRDGKELYFLDPAGRMMAAKMTIKGAAMEPGAPVALFASGISGGGLERQQLTQYDVAPDGRFIISRDIGSAAAPITLLMNWKPEGKK